jgi:CubicO group peptidase (beta-lactamase class C family)
LTADDPFTAPLVPLPPQPADTPWPTDAWPTGPAPEGVPVEAFLDELFDDRGPLATTFAAVVIHRGRLVAQRYAHAIEHFDRDPETITAATPLLSWSMAKSMLHAVVGMLVAEGRLVLDAPTDVPEWRDAGDGRETITPQQLLEMRDGLDFVEDYVDDTRSDVIEMLFGTGARDVAHFAADRPLVAAPGERFNYSSGTTNIVSAIVCRVVGSRDAYERLLRDRLFGPLGMRTATARFDDAGTWIASSYVYCSAQDFARFGYLYLRDGVWNGERVLPAGWVDHARRVRSFDPDGGNYYGAHWWLYGDAYGTFACVGYEGQYIWCVPALDLIVVRLGKTPAEKRAQLTDWRRRITDAFAEASS